MEDDVINAIDNLVLDDNVNNLLANNIIEIQAQGIGIGWNNAWQPGDDNTAMGAFSLCNLTTGNRISALGSHSGCSITVENNCSCVGYKSDTTADDCVVIGCFSIAEKKNGIVVGNNSISKHENSIAVGNDIESTSKDSVRQVCLIPMTSGLKWTYDSQCTVQKRDNDEKIYETITCDQRTLCFECMFKFLLDQKARDNWAENTNTKTLLERVELLEKQIASIKIEK